MGKPKKRTSPRRTGSRRSHLVVKLARVVNATSTVKAFTTRGELGTSRPHIPKPAKNGEKKLAKSAAK